MLPGGSASKVTTTKATLWQAQRSTRMPSNTTIERCGFLFVHCLFYVIILTIVYIRLEQFAIKQEKSLTALRSNGTTGLAQELDPRLQNPDQASPLENDPDCSCPTLPLLKRNRTSCRLQLRVGLIDTIDNVFCPTSTTNEPINVAQRPWLRIQSRESNAVDFNRTWHEYRRGFGHVQNRTDFWIGNENLHWLTTTYSCRLKIELTDWYNETRTATYEMFSVASQNDGYRIRIGEYHGDMEPSNKIDSFSYWHHNARFSTYDHYTTSTNCPQLHSGCGWWYHSGVDCARVQLNGRLATHSDGLIPLNTGILWFGWKSDRHYSFKHVHMAIQPKARRSRLTYRY